MLVFDVAEVFSSDDHRIFCFPDVVFMAVCACDYVDRVWGINTWGVKDG